MNETFNNDIAYTDIIVSDTGIGISKEDLPQIFNRYFQASNRQKHTTGTGIGLALAKNLADLHEAELLVDSSLNEGSTFTLRLLTNNSYPEALHPENQQIQESNFICLFQGQIWRRGSRIELQVFLSVEGMRILLDRKAYD